LEFRKGRMKLFEEMDDATAFGQSTIYLQKKSIKKEEERKNRKGEGKRKKKQVKRRFLFKK